ncbi:hypothetical protein V2E24_01625 [Mycoplasmopsis ciconiae]|uniref:Membrane protein P80 n=1 Tax=Mycoplasmopsis ciconiae TaxID=561067 RepID=A0ABU7ML66_9BACT|nr:hypothetical protein [Mycoplasmopsis ciconiae]
MAKNKQSFFEKLSEKNAKHDEKKVSTTSKSKKRNIKAYITLAVLAVGVAGAITIPLVVSNKNVKYVEPIADDQKIISITSPDSNKKDISVKELLDDLNLSKNQNSQKIEDVYKQALYYLYEQEVKASKNFELLWNASLLPSETKKTNIALPTLDEVKNKQESVILDLERNLKSVYGLDNWETKFNEELAGERFGKSKTKEEAVEFLTLEAIKNDALRRFTLEKTSDSFFKNINQINRSANNNIYKSDENDKIVGNQSTGQSEILFAKGAKVFPEFELNKNYFLDPNSDKVYVFKTRSFDPKLWDQAYIFSDEYVKQNTLFVPEQFKIDIKAPSTITGDFKVNKNSYINYVSYTIKDLSLFKVSDYLKEIKSVSSLVINDQSMVKEYSDLYQSMLSLLSNSSDKVKENLGSYGVLDANSYVQNSEESISLSSYVNVFENDQNRLPSVNFLDLFNFPYNDETQAKIDSLKQKISEVENNSQKVNELSNLVFELNTVIKNYISSLSDQEFEKILNTLIRKIFYINVNESNYISLAYRAKDIDNVYVILDSQGLSLVKKQPINSEDFKKLLISDLKNTANNEKLNFNTLNIIDKAFSSKSYDLDVLLNDDVFVSYLKYDQEKITELKNINTNFLEANKSQQSIKSFTDLQNKINKWKLDTSIYNFAFKDAKLFIDYNKQESNTLSENDATQTIFDYLAKLLNINYKTGAK